jgi:SAM-dependent methyltransferase
MQSPVGLFDFGSLEDLVDSLEKVLDREREDIVKTLFFEAVETGTTVRQAAEEFGVTPHVYNEKMRRFYSETDAFVFELTVGHMRKACKEIDRRVIDAVHEFSSGNRVLCLGDGIGTDSLRFALDSFEVTYFEFEGSSSQFAKHRFARSSALEDTHLVHELENIPLGTHDVVVCREVLEHVPSPLQVIEDIWCYLDSGGVAVITESFSRIEKRFPTHIEDNQKYAGKTKKLFVDEGFELLKSYPGGRPVVFRKTQKNDMSRYDDLQNRKEGTIKNLARKVGKRLISSMPNI